MKKRILFQDKQAIRLVSYARRKIIFLVFLQLILILIGCFPTRPKYTSSNSSSAPQYLVLGGMRVDPSEKITDWTGRYQFNYSYTYDFDLQKGSQAYYSECIVVVQINSSGTGRLVTALNGEKNVLEITSCYKENNRVTINAKNEYGKVITTHFAIEQNFYTNKFWIDGQNNTCVVFQL